MSTTNKSKNITFTFRTNSDLMNQAKEVAQKNNLDMSYILNALIQKLVETQEVPAELFETEASKDQTIKDLFSEMKASYEFFESGEKGKTLDEVFSKYGV